MHIDAFTVIAQIINFLILIWLLKRFLYGPITAAMAARQHKIAAALEQARQQAEQAEQAAQDYQAQRAELEAQRAAWLEQARQEVDLQRQVGLEQARQEVDAQRATWLTAWRREQRAHRQALQQEAARRLTDALRGALQELADADLEQRMLMQLLARLQTLDEGQSAALAGSGPWTVRTAFPLDAELQGRVRTVLSAWAKAEIRLSFAPDLPSAAGVVLELPEHRLAWTVEHYLDGFAAALAAVLNAPPGDAHEDD